MEQFVLDDILSHLEKPARYLGSEWNTVHKDWDGVSVRMAFAFPDLYEVGMSHLGLQILYGLVNTYPDYLMERVFAPAPDLEAELRRRGLPLFSLESHRPLRDFDILGFTLQYELTFTNILNMIDLAGISLLASERSAFDPLVIAGGPVAANPEPLAPFIDAFVIGEGEEVLPEILAAIRQIKQGDTRWERGDILEKLAGIPGVYIPSCYSVEYSREGRVQGFTGLCPDAPSQVRRRLVQDLDAVYYPTAPVVPLVEAVHERGMLELFRGCTRGCRFCQAGMIYRPVRERHARNLQQQAGEIIASTGYEELSLVSLSSLDYSDLDGLLQPLRDRCTRSRTGISLPSLRVDSFSVDVARQLPGGRRTSLTLAPEAGTQRLRDVINKGVTEADLLEAVAAAVTAGWSAIKLYFMVGLPTEEQADLEGIGDLVRKVRQTGRSAARGRHKLRISVSASSFVPKAHTPFQWEGQLPRPLLAERHAFLRDLVRNSGADYHWHDIGTSFLEAVLARGDRRLAAVLVEAWRRGCRFDGWTEHFHFDRWQESFRTVGLDPEFYAVRKLAYDEVLPWDLIDAGVDREFLIREHRRALAGVATPDCRRASCEGCGVCPALEVEPRLAIKAPSNLLNKLT
ncbi:MAG: TIGR03960 family B12-binding radical SAM protein [Thermacetogeniaceae bacterium]